MMQDTLQYTPVRGWSTSKLRLSEHQEYLLEDIPGLLSRCKKHDDNEI